MVDHSPFSLPLFTELRGKGSSKKFADGLYRPQGMGGETTPAPAGYPTLPDPTLIG